MKTIKLWKSVNFHKITKIIYLVKILRQQEMFVAIHAEGRKLEIH
jgi:hypothetical protein